MSERVQGGRALYSHAPDRTDGFPVAAERVVRFLSDAVPLCAWLVALVDSGGGWTPVAAADRGYGFVLGARLSWQDTLCSRMVQGLGPHVSARVETDTSYANAPIGQSYPIRAYVGTALLDPSGDVVGTLCGLDPGPQPPELEQHLPVVRVLAELLSSVHAAEHRLQDTVAQLAAAQAAALRCPLTGALSRRGWLERLQPLASVGDRSGQDLALVCLDLDGLKHVNDTQGHAAGDELLVRVAGVIGHVLRPADLLARLGGDEFAVAAVVSSSQGVPRLARRLRDALDAAGLPVSLGAALRPPGEPVDPAWQAPDAAMYAQKQERRRRPGPSGTSSSAAGEVRPAGGGR